MPNPLEILLDPVSLMFSGIYLLLMLWERIFPARKLPYVHFWQAKGIVAYVFFLMLSMYLPLAYAAWLPSAALIDLSSMNSLVAAAIGILVYELGIYGWHRLMHSKDLLWRVFHQMHHSAERLDTFGAFFFSPMDMIGFTVLGTLSISILIGIPAESITLFLLVTNFFNVFQHANIKTPVWLGYFIQRPESHSIHHAKGVHAFNYSDMPIFDILFGTFRNPSHFVAETGLYQGASSKVKDMLLFKNIAKIILIGASTFLVTLPSYAQNEASEKSVPQEKKWLIEPIKLTSLMVNTHPEYNGWGLEVGRKITDKLWVTSMIEKTKGGDFLKNFDPAYDFLITFKYSAWLNTFRYYLKPNARYSPFIDAGIEYQSATHKFLRDNSVFEEKAHAVGPILFVGGEWHFPKNIYLKWRSGFFINAYRTGGMKSRIDDGQNQPAFFMYPHLADAVIGKGNYAGDVALGIKF